MPDLIDVLAAARERAKAEGTIRGDDTTDQPEGDGWEPFAVDNGRIWWRRRT